MKTYSITAHLLDDDNQVVTERAFYYNTGYGVAPGHDGWNLLMYNLAAQELLPSVGDAIRITGFWEIIEDEE